MTHTLSHPIKIRRFIPLLLVIFLPVGAFSADLATMIDGIAKKEIETDGGVGMTIAIAKDDNIIYLKGYGLANVELSVPATAESVYRIGSITKMFTAAGILLLMEEGKLSLDDLLSKHLPEYPADPGDKITIRHLLNHTSGLVNLTDLPDHREIMRDDLTHGEVLARFQDMPSLFAPGDQFRYCNSGYYLLGMIIENVSELKYEPFLQERVLDPLDLKNTTYDRHLKIIPNRASGYGRWGDQLVNAPYVSMRTPFAAGALASTAEDLIRWTRALATDKLLQADSFKAMTTPGQLNSGKAIPYGFGCFVGKLDGHPYFHHGGGIPGFVTELVYFPEDELTVVVLTNAGRNSPKKIADQIARSILN